MKFKLITRGYSCHDCGVGVGTLIPWRAHPCACRGRREQCLVYHELFGIKTVEHDIIICF